MAKSKEFMPSPVLYVFVHHTGGIHCEDKKICRSYVQATQKDHMYSNGKKATVCLWGYKDTSTQNIVTDHIDVRYRLFILFDISHLKFSELVLTWSNSSSKGRIKITYYEINSLLMRISCSVLPASICIFTEISCGMASFTVLIKFLLVVDLEAGRVLGIETFPFV